MAVAMAMARGCLVLVMVMTVVVASVATGETGTLETFPVAGRKYKVQNKPMAPELGVACPEGNPNTVTFCKEGAMRVKIVGNFAAADLGVCDPSVNPYTLDANTVVTYEQYGDQVIFRIPDRVPSAFRCLLQPGKKMCFGLSGQRYGVSTLTDLGAAYC